MTEVDVQNVYKALLQYGLRIRQSELTSNEAIRQKNVIRGLLAENNSDVLIDAIKYGMRNVWPFSEVNDMGQARVFSAVDLEAKLLEAKASASQMRRAGQIAYRPRRKS